MNDQETIQQFNSLIFKERAELKQRIDELERQLARRPLVDWEKAKQTRYSLLGEIPACTCLSTPPTYPTFRDNPHLESCVVRRTYEAAMDLVDLALRHDAEWGNKVKQLEREKDLAIKEANRRDQKWQQGLNEECGVELNYGLPHIDEKRPTFGEFIHELRQRVKELEHKNTELREALEFIGGKTDHGHQDKPCPICLTVDNALAETPVQSAKEQ